jgi:hypothetical protein
MSLPLHTQAYTEAAIARGPVPPGGVISSPSSSSSGGPGERLTVILLLSDGEDVCHMCIAISVLIILINKSME